MWLLAAALGSGRATAQELRPQVELSRDKEWFGDLRISGSLPAEEGGQSVALEVLLPSEGRGAVFLGTRYHWKSGSGEAVDVRDRFRTVGLATVSSEGRFELPFVESAPPGSLFRIRPTGRFLSGNGLHFKLDDRWVPDFSKPLVVEAAVGYAAEFRLHLPKDATPLERSTLAGRRLAFLGESQGNYSSEQFERMLEAEAVIEQPKDPLRGPLIARLERIGLQPLTFDSPRNTSKIEGCLAPFYVSAIPKVEPAPGKEVACDVQLKRGIVLAGIVRDSKGRAIERARVNIRCDRVEGRLGVLECGPRDGLMHRNLAYDISASTDAKGRFISHAVPADFEGLRVSGPNGGSVWIDAAHIPVGERSRLRLVVPGR